MITKIRFIVCSFALTVFSGLSAQNDTTFIANGNPIIKYKYTGDPAAMVHNGKVYIYAGHDECPPPKEHYLLNEWCVFSSPDMKTWTEHPVPLKAKDFSWAKGEAWASQVIERDGKFYWYVTVEHGTIPGKSIGVAVSDSPTGPFVDARGSALITNDMTTEYTNIRWDDIDPTVFIDDDGRKYMYFDRFNDGLNIWMCELENDLLRIKPGTMQKCIHVSQEWETVWPRVNEGCFVIKHNGIYYMTYSANSYESPNYGVGCATADSPAGPWTKYGHNPLLQFPGDLVGVGHSAMFKDKTGRLRIVFHAHNSKEKIHPRNMFISNVMFRYRDGAYMMEIDKKYMVPQMAQ